MTASQAAGGVSVQSAGHCADVHGLDPCSKGQADEDERRRCSRCSWRRASLSLHGSNPQLFDEMSFRSIA